MKPIVRLLWLLMPLVTLAGERDRAQVGEELTAWAQARNLAWRDRDRAGLERLYAEEFAFIHAFGYRDDRTTQINEMLAMGTVSDLPPPSFAPPNELYLYGDVAVHRFVGYTARGTATFGTAIYVHRDGRWRMALQQHTERAPEHPAVQLDPAVLETYLGRYDRGDGTITVIALENGALVARHAGFPGRLLTPASDTTFYDKLGSEWTFHRGPDARVTHYRLRFRDGREAQSTRVD